MNSNVFWTGAVMATALLWTSADAEEWYTLSHETYDATFSIQEDAEGGADVWLRFATGHGAPQETRLHLEIACNPATAAAIEARQRDANGQELVRRLPADVFANEPWLPVLTAAVCQFEPAQRPSGILDSSATQSNLARMLRSEDAAERRRAVDLILSEPGAFPPLMFIPLAQELIEQGREREAAEWYAFGYARMLIDMRAAVRVDERYADIAGMISPMYGITGPHELGPLADPLDHAQKRDLMVEAINRDAQIPRFYPVDWFVSPVSVMNVAWGSTEAPRPGTDFAIRRELDSARNELRETPAEP